MKNTKEYYESQISALQQKIDAIDLKLEKPQHIGFFQLRTYRKGRAIMNNKIKMYKKLIALLPQLSIFD